jgi:hypothetical protein
MSELKFKHCIVCEDIRFERRNLNSLMGVYGATPDVGILVKDLKLEVGFLMVFYGAPATGEFHITAQLLNKAGEKIGSKIQPETFKLTLKEAMGAAVAAFRFNTIFPTAGQYSVALNIGNDEIFRGEFQIVLSRDDAELL